jgi:hypothetical protein
MNRWLVSRRFDLAFFTAPALVSVALLAISPANLFARDDLPVWIWVVLIPLVDVSHVYASLYRTYFDAGELGRRPALYATVPAGVFLIGTMAYAVDAALFWRILAYAAVWHFVRQQYGFLALYRHGAGERSRLEGRLDAALLYATTLYPLLFWHTHPRRFVWFVEGDFVTLSSAWITRGAGVVYALLAAAYLVKEAVLYARGRTPSTGKNLVILTTALSWYVGIVRYDSDYAFTVTNVLSHGVPYVALVWIHSRRKWSAAAARSWLGWVSQPRAAAAFVGVLVFFAFCEEGLWDLLVWGDHPSVFGGRNHVLAMTDSPLLPFLVGLLALPQATHYVLDGFIWKMGPRNPDLRDYLLPPAPAVAK